MVKTKVNTFKCYWFILGGTWYTRGSQRTTRGGQFFVTTKRILRIKLGSLGLAASVFPLWVTSLAFTLLQTRLSKAQNLGSRPAQFYQTQKPTPFWAMRTSQAIGLLLSGWLPLAWSRKREFKDKGREKMGYIPVMIRNGMFWRTIIKDPKMKGAKNLNKEVDEFRIYKKAVY